MLKPILAVTKLLLALAILQFGNALAFAADGDPLALRNWPGGMVSIETHSGLHVVINPQDDAGSIAQLPRAADLVLFGPGDIEGLTGENSIVISADGNADGGVDHFLFRKPNEAKINWLPASDQDVPSGQAAIRVKSFPLDSESDSHATTAVLLETDSVAIVVVPPAWFAKNNSADVESELADLAEIDLLLFPSTTTDGPLPAGFVRLAKQLRPKFVAVGTSAASVEAQKRIASQIDSNLEPVTVSHNTLALAHNADRTREGTQVVLLKEAPWQMPDELVDLFARMENACSESQTTFAKLSVEQMNFRPMNGTHTPRWNTEHMMGRQLLFFSQIYHHQNPVIPIMDLNPKQMPPDYRAAHPDWDGREEARQMQRVSEFTRRFAYLLEGLDLDQKPPGSNWQLRALIKQMDRHYTEHTANTVKKFELPDWPGE